jgi:hypothetical protein
MHIYVYVYMYTYRYMNKYEYINMFILRRVERDNVRNMVQQEGKDRGENANMHQYKGMHYTPLNRNL